MHFILDSIAPLRNTKQRKFCKGKNVDNAIDRISDLPEAVLHHILSFLPTKYVVGTSVLSKRWKYIWTSIHILDFDDYLRFSQYQIRGDQSSFVNFVDRVLKLCNVSNIQKFRLRLRSLKPSSLSEISINEWVLAAIMHKVQELNFRFFVNESFRLPSSLFTCESLTILKLKIDCDLDIPTSICFPSLKIMHLGLVCFWDEECTRQLFSSCPLLEELILDGCTWKNIKIIKISAPALRSLTIDQSHDGHGLNECKLEVNAPTLVSLKFVGCVAGDHSLESMSSLFDAYIDTSEYHYEGHHYSVLTLLRGISKVKILRMFIDTEHVFIADFLAQLPTFHNLNHLELIMYGSKVSGLILSGLLRCSPNLEILVFNLDIDYHIDEYDGQGWGSLGVQQEGLLPVLKELEIRDFDWSLYVLDVVEYSLKNTKVLEKMTLVSSGQLLPDAKEQILDLLSHLKTVEIRNFTGNVLELELVKFLLKNALVLEKMIIISSSQLLADLKKQLDISWKLLMCPKGSTSVILFS